MKRQTQSMLTSFLAAKPKVSKPEQLTKCREVDKKEEALTQAQTSSSSSSRATPIASGEEVGRLADKGNITPALDQKSTKATEPSGDASKAGELPNSMCPSELATVSSSLFSGLATDWAAALATCLADKRMTRLAEFVVKERAAKTPIYPPVDQVFSWSKQTPVSQVRVVILGQDPYHGPGQAHGLAFSVLRPTPKPPSLANIYRQLGREVDELPGDGAGKGRNKPWPPEHGDLTSWARQGVLLLNAVLTVRAGEPNSHRDKGWEVLTDAVITHVNKTQSNVVFLLWGAYAQKKGAVVDRKRHLVLEAPHPSPLSASRGFFGCNHFAKANAYLVANGHTAIDWYTLD